MKTYHVSGNRKSGFRIAIPLETYEKEGTPSEEYNISVFQDGSFLCQPVHP